MLHLIESISNGQEGEEEEEGEGGNAREGAAGEEDEKGEEREDKFGSLVEAIAAGIERKRRLFRLDGMLRKLDGVLGAENGVAKRTAHETVVKGEVLLRRHLKIGGKDLKMYLKKAGERMDAEMLEVIGEEMRRAEGEVKDVLFEFLRALLQREGLKVARGLDGVIVELCRRDVELFDIYMSLLLRWLGEAKEGEAVVRLVAEGKMSVRKAAEERVRNGGAREDEVDRWVRELAESEG